MGDGDKMEEKKCGRTKMRMTNHEKWDGDQVRDRDSNPERFSLVSLPYEVQDRI